MTLKDLPYEKRKLLAVEQYGPRSSNQTTAQVATAQVRSQHGLNPLETIVFGGFSMAAAALADSRRRGKLRDLGLTPTTVLDAGVFKFPDGHPAVGRVYAAHPYDRATYYPLSNIHGYLLGSWVRELMALFRSAGAGFVDVQAADSTSERELRMALGLPLVTDTGIVLGQADTEVSIKSQANDHVSLQWRGAIRAKPKRATEALRHPFIATEPVIRDIVETLVDGTMDTATATVSSSRDFNFTPELVAKVERMGFELGGSFHRHTSSKLIVRVARDPRGFA